MKKILSTLACVVALASIANADFLRVEAGAGAWMQTPSGGLVGTSSGFVGSDTSNETSQTEGYVWVMVKHFVPIVPNLRLEYVSTTNEGTAEGSFSGSVGSSPSNLDLTQYDIIPYYNLLDNTFWLTLDVGLDIKVIDMEYTVDEENYKETGTAPIPMLYVRARTEIPFTEIGLEADVKYVSYSDTTVYDIRVKVDYTLDFVPIIQPALEVGYRVQKFESDDLDDITLDIDYAGVYAGLMLRF